MKVLVLGAGGQVGRAVMRAMPSQHVAIPKVHADLDITDQRAVELFLGSSGVDWMVNAAAYTAVDLAEDQPGAASAVNDTAVGIMARAASGAGCRLLHLSTDFVFDGQSARAYLPTDPPRPLSVYGATKLAGERQVMQSAGKGVVLRTSWVYAAAGRNFVLTMLRLMRERPEVKVVADQIGAPTWATSIAHAIWGLMEADAPSGIHHWTDLGVASWYDFAVAIQDDALERGLLKRAVPIVPIATPDYPTRAQRPAFSVLDTASTRALLPGGSNHWRHNLRLMLDELRAA